MKSIDEIENERNWTMFAVLCQLIVVLFGLIFFGYFALYMWVLGRIEGEAELLSHAISLLLICGCLAPGIALWQRLRSNNRYAVLYGLAVAAAVSICAPLLIGAPLGVNPQSPILESLLF